jgi:prepilin-type N-terminal cleavage/methylation domain-containing protein
MNARGFTLVEMLVSLSIFAVVTAFVTANFRAGRQGDELRVSSQLVASSIRRAQTLAIAGQTVFWCDGGAQDRRTCPGGTDAECGGGVCRRDIPDGYGAHFSTVDGEDRRVTVFADIDGDLRYDEGEAIRSDSVSSGPFVFVQALAPEDGSALDIVFTPPRPGITFNGDTSQVVAAIDLAHRETGAVDTVSVNAVSGQVNIE